MNICSYSNLEINRPSPLVFNGYRVSSDTDKMHLRRRPWSRVSNLEILEPGLYEASRSLAYMQESKTRWLMSKYSGDVPLGKKTIPQPLVLLRASCQKGKKTLPFQGAAWTMKGK